MADVSVLVRQLQSIYLFGDGAPAGAPQAPRAVYTDVTGAPGAVLYVWNGSTWTAVA
jgi:hypothetical protein